MELSYVMNVSNQRPVSADRLDFLAVLRVEKRTPHPICRDSFNRYRQINGFFLFTEREKAQVFWDARIPWRRLSVRVNTGFDGREHDRSAAGSDVWVRLQHWPRVD